MAVTVFKVHNSECDLHQDIMLFDVSWLITSDFQSKRRKKKVKSLHGKPYFFSRRPEKMVFPKRSCWNMNFFVLSGNIIFLFHENMILPPRQKMKDDLSQKSTWKYDILLKILKRWSFQKDDTGIWSFLYYLERWYFFCPGTWNFFSGRKMKDHLFQEIHGNMEESSIPCIIQPSGVVFGGELERQSRKLFAH